jgi:hypothetical protein
MTCQHGWKQLVKFTGTCFFSLFPTAEGGSHGLDLEPQGKMGGLGYLESRATASNLELFSPATLCNTQKPVGKGSRTFQSKAPPIHEGM